MSFDSGLDNEGQKPIGNDEGWEEFPLSKMTLIVVVTSNIRGHYEWGRE